MQTKQADALIIGAGAAGMMCALTAAQRGRRVYLLDHATKLAEKIRISGGGRCNFTNLDVRQENYLSQNPHFCRSALARYTSQNFIDLLHKHGITYHEKTRGQLFCDQGSEAIIRMLKAECDAAGVRWCRPCRITEVRHEKDFQVQTGQGIFQAPALVIATGGLAIPKIGATPFAYRLAEQFSIPITPLKPGLVPLSFHPESWQPYAELSGVSLEGEIRCARKSFQDQILFTHRGLSGPVILQISSYWQSNLPLQINLLPGHDMQELFLLHRTSRMLMSNFLAQYLPSRLASLIATLWVEDKPLNQYGEKAMRKLAEQLHNWEITPTGTLGYAKAEVTCGGIDTRALSSQTMMCHDVPGLYFVGEAVDVTGWLGGYNLQWAWASGYAAGMAV